MHCGTARNGNARNGDFCDGDGDRRRHRHRHRRRGFPTLRHGFALTVLISGWLGGWLTTVSIAQTPSDDRVLREQSRRFESEIRPLLVAHCIKCHGPEKQEGKLRLDSLEAMVRGGESGPALEAGSSTRSLIVSAVRHQDLEMPPNKRLADHEVDALAAWIDRGAYWPEAGPSGLELRRKATLTEDDRNYWAFRPLAHVTVPEVDTHQSRQPIDNFIVSKLAESGLSLAPTASPHILARRLYFDLVGVPPTPQELEAFVRDSSENAYEALVDRLLEDPRYGERWARHWLDLVRYAESDGFKQDAYRPTAYLYRDYVIDALNSDLPYDQFVTEQLAGDEMTDEKTDNDPRRLAATGYLRHWIYEYNQRDVRSQWENILNDLTDVTGEVFLGLGMGCARCHDHKFDPILQKDYYRLQASFAAFLPKDDVVSGDRNELERYHQQQSAWEKATASIRSQIDSIEQEYRQNSANKAIDKFPPDIRPMLRRDPSMRPPYERQIVALALRQVGEEKLDFSKILKDSTKQRWESLKEELAKFDDLKPARKATILAAGEIGPEAPPTLFPPAKVDSVAVAPASLEVLGGKPLTAIPPAHGRSTGRRTALAAWINDPSNPLTHRVIVNRIWQYHFGSGLVANASDFGRLGQPPTHPELLDWLANTWLEEGRSFKRLHKRIVSSATYRQSSQHPDRLASESIDPDNRLLWHFPARRLDAEQVRDAMLVASGAIEWKMGGPATDHKSFRRTIYAKVMRNTPDPMLSVLDGPDGSASLAKRNATTTAVQSLLLANSPWPILVAEKMAGSLRSEEASTDRQLSRAYERCYGRQPTPEELNRAIRFVDRQMQQVATDAATAPPESSGDSSETPNHYSRALSDFCHVLLNSSEFLYLD